MRRPTRQELLGWAWLAVTVAIALHVADETAHDFLATYNPVARAFQERLGLPFPPVFSFPVWLGGLVLAVVALLAVTPRVFRGTRLFAWLGLALGLLMLANGAGHALMSLAVGRALPGVISAPLLAGCSVVLVLAAAGILRQATSPSAG